MRHFVTSYMKQNKSRKQTLESAQNGLEIIFKPRDITGYNSIVQTKSLHQVLLTQKRPSETYFISYLKFSDRFDFIKNSHGNFLIQSQSRNDFLTRGKSVSSNKKSTVKMNQSVRITFT